MSAPDEPGCVEWLRLVPGVSAASGADLLYLATWRRRHALGSDAGWKRTLLAALSADFCRPSTLAAAVCSDVEAPLVERFLAALSGDGWLISGVGDGVGDGARPRYRLVPIGPIPPPPDSLTDPPVLSRFGVLRRAGEELVLESPLARARLETDDPAVTDLLGRLALIQRSDTDGRPGTDDPIGGLRPRLYADLRRSGLAVSDPSAEDSDPQIALWSPHELWFHRRSRMDDRCYTTEGYGRTQWARGRFDPLPAHRDRHSGPAIELTSPDPDHREDLSLHTALERRRSIRTHDDSRPITVDQLGALLYRCARVRSVRQVDGVDYVSRPYPSGGAAHELELYPVVRLVDGLEPGMYHYDAHAHLLRMVRPAGPETRQTLNRAARASLQSGSVPQVVLLITARFGRVMWAYERMPYALILKHIGVLYQTMYLVATAMGLAACALGGGDATEFNELTGVDYTTESAVGEFLLGSRTPDDHEGEADGPAAAS